MDGQTCVSTGVMRSVRFVLQTESELIWALSLFTDNSVEDVRISPRFLETVLTSSVFMICSFENFN